MSEFKRYLSPAGLRLLETRPGWWRDLLAFRYRVAGEEQPLVLAVRAGYLNAYLEGQSVLKIGFKGNEESVLLAGEIHHKYVYEGAKDQKSLSFDGATIDGQPYNGADTFELWARKARTFVKRSSSSLEFTEKEGVAVIANGNSNVIDVEMGHNGTGDRIDLVALEKGEGAIRIVFYEAKLFQNGELRARSLEPTVLKQLQRYEDWVSAPGRIAEIVKAYRETCAILIRLNETRDPHDRLPIHPLVKEAATGQPLVVDVKPRLIVFGYEPCAPDSGAPKDKSWPRHEAALRQHGVKLILSPTPQGVLLPEVAPEPAFFDG